MKRIPAWIILSILSISANLLIAQTPEELKLFDAVLRGNEAKVEEALTQGTNPNTTNPFGYTPLHYAAAGNNTNLIPLLIKHGAEYQPNHQAESPLLIAAERSSYKQVLILLQAGFDPNVTSQNEMNLLNHAVQRDDPALYQLALQHGLSPMKERGMKTLAIHQACLEESQRILPQLIDAMEGQLDPQTAMGWTPLHCAASVGNVPAIHLLAKSGANLNQMARVGGTPLHIAAERGEESAVAALISLGAIVHIPDTQQNYPIHKAIHSGNLLTLMQFLGKGADLNIIDKEGNTPLQIAANEGRTYMAHILIEHGAAPSISKLPQPWVTLMKDNTEDFTALITNTQMANLQIGGIPLLHWAIQRIVGNTLDHLIEKGADPTQTDSKGNTAMHLAGQVGDYALIPKLLKAGGSMSAQNQTGQTPLHLAVQNNRLEFIRTFLATGGDINAKDFMNQTPLHLAAKQKTNPELLPLLLKSQPDLRATNTKGQSPLHIASLAGQKKQLTLLITPETINSQDNKGNTPLHLAAQKGHKEAVQYLLQNGASPKIANQKGYTPAQLAIQNWHLETLKELPSEYEQ